MASHAPQPLFELRSANAAYNGRNVLTNISVTIRRQERVALLGKSGAGKSTLLRMLHSRNPNGTALIPQDLGLVHTLSVFHNVFMGRLNQHSTWYNLVNLVRPLKREVEGVRQVLETLEFADKMFTPVGELSGGQRQRTAVGRAIFQGEQALLGDEPVSSVDEVQAHVVLGALSQTYETIVLAMHDVELALQYTTRVIGVQDGRIVLDEPSQTLSASDLAPLYQS